MEDCDGRTPQNLIRYKIQNRLDLIDFLIHTRMRLRL